MINLTSEMVVCFIGKDIGGVLVKYSNIWLTLIISGWGETCLSKWEANKFAFSRLDIEIDLSGYLIRVLSLYALNFIF